MSTKNNNEYHELDKQFYLQTFKRYPITFSHGKGSRLWDVEGKEYIDTLAGIAVNAVGHAHPKLVGAIQKQASELMHVSNFFLSEPQVKLSEKLRELSGLDRVFFTNSGAESVEAAIKIARKYAHSLGRGGTILSFEGSFHGRTMATIATGKKKMQEGFEPIPEGFGQIPFNDIDTVKENIRDEIAAFIIEPIQGEGGIHPANKEFIKELRSICSKNNIVLIFDEIQSGIGRTGKWFTQDIFGVQPDIMTLAKGLGGGMPIGAVLSSEKVSQAMNFGDHGTTFGGNPLACRAALTTLQIIEEEGLLIKASENGQWLMNKINELNDPSVKKIRGMGLMIGVEFDFETKPLVEEMLDRGVVANATAGNVLRLVPPLNISLTDLEKVVETIEESLKVVKQNA